MFRIVNFGAEHLTPTVICLGRFESLHKGHKRIIDEAISMAKPLGAEVMLMTFDLDNLRFRGVILTFEERIALAEDLGVSSALKISFNDEFKALTAEEFLSTLKSTINLKGIVCGFDFHFGCGRRGDTDTLKEFCEKSSLLFKVVDKVSLEGEKIATTTVKDLLTQGDISRADEMLGYRFFVKGEVIRGREVGRTLGFPTANIKIPQGKNILPLGVYLTATTVDGKEYKGITNCGTAPTFGCEDVLIETHLGGFDGNLYDRSIKVEFIERIRDIKKFNSKDELTNQLNEDLKRLL